MKYLAVILGTCCALSLSTTALAADVDEAMLEEGKVLFQSGAAPACAVCHALEDAESTGNIGPDLDEVQPSADAVKQTMIDGPGPMPSFSDSLSEDEMDAIAAYVEHATQD